MADELERARAFYGQRAWQEAHAAFDSLAELGPDDLERFAHTAFFLGRDDECLRILDASHHVCLDAGLCRGAARAAFWLSLHLLLRGESARANGWLARGLRVIEREPECVERGYLELSAAEQRLSDADAGAALEGARRAAAFGERFADADLIACARHAEGRALIAQGEIDAGLALLDEVMVAVTSGELSPTVTGLIYCSVLGVCRDVYALGRAGEWTEAMSVWCGAQPQMVALRGACLVHRAEIFQLRGAWPQALAEAELACARAASERPAAAFYQKGELHRLRGEFTRAQAAYGEASRCGCEPQPGLALLRLAQGRAAAAASALRRMLKVTEDPLGRARLLPAYVEILLAAGEREEARTACSELERIAADFASDALDAVAAHARGAVELDAGDAEAAAIALRRALAGWHRLDAPYLEAQTRELIGRACRDLGDEDGSALELGAAAATYAELGAAHDLARLRADPPRGGLTRRELEVLRLIAQGKTNHAIAAGLGISSRTVDRHVSNLFGKLGVSTRAAATARAYQADLL